MCVQQLGISILYLTSEVHRISIRKLALSFIPLDIISFTFDILKHQCHAELQSLSG